MDPFEILGLPRRFALDPAELEARYRELSRAWHPDRHGRAPAAERVRILRRATDLNEAYRLLRSDSQRAAYLLRLRGVDVGAETPGAQPLVDAAFLTEILDLREALAEARAAGDDARVRVLDARVRGEARAALGRVAAGFARLEAGDGPEEALVNEITKNLVALRYFQRLHDEIDAYEEGRISQGEIRSLEPTPERAAK